MSLAVFSFLFSSKAQQTVFDSYPVYKGNDLGLTYATGSSVLKIWSPVAGQAAVLIYEEGSGGKAVEEISMQKSDGGVWTATLSGCWIMSG